MAEADIISSLPDDILHHIFSFIPSKQAITTSILSKRWQHVWTKTPCLFFDCRRVDNYSISKTLSNYSSLKLKSLELYITSRVSATQIDSWIQFGMSRNPEVMFLCVKKSSKTYTIPDSFFTSSSVKQLTLELLHSKTVPIRYIAWTSLKSLTLGHCNLPDESIANILAGCPMLETLVLNWCKELCNLDLSKYVKVTRLEVHITLTPIKIVLPHVRCLVIRNIDYRTSLVNVSSLMEANFDLVCRLHFHGDSGVVERSLKMLTKLRNVQELTLGVAVLQTLSLLESRGVPFPQLKVKTLTVETILIRSVIPGITRLIQNSPELKKITLYTNILLNLMDEKELGQYLISQSLNPDICWGELFPKAEEVYIYSFTANLPNTTAEHVASFMEIVLHNAKKLEAMVLRLEGYLSEAEFQRLVPKCGQAKALLYSFKIIP